MRWGVDAEADALDGQLGDLAKRLLRCLERPVNELVNLVRRRTLSADVHFGYFLRQRGPSPCQAARVRMCGNLLKVWQPRRGRTLSACSGDSSGLADGPAVTRRSPRIVVDVRLPPREWRPATCRVGSRSCSSRVRPAATGRPPDAVGR